MFFNNSRLMMLLTAFSMIVCTVFCSSGFAQDPNSNAVEKITLMLAPQTPLTASFSVFVQSKSDVSMLFAPKTSILSQLNVAGNTKLYPDTASKAGVIIQDMETLSASMSFYTPGQPNKDIESELLKITLLESGIPALKEKVVLHLSSTGKTLSVEGVAASYTPYFLVSSIEFANTPVAKDLPWIMVQEVPICPDPNQAPIWCRMTATYSIARIDKDADEADISATSVFEPHIADQTASNTTSGYKFSGNSTGTMRVRISDGIITLIDTRCKFKLDFGAGNYIDMEETFNVSLTNIKPQ